MDFLRGKDDWISLHPLYHVWSEMKQRCNNPNRPNYSYYGGRGISYCVKWQLYSGFYEDMVEGWQAGLILDRIDGNKGYYKENCRWVTPVESSRNRPSNALTLEKAREIRFLYSTGECTQRALAKMYNTSLANINRTLHNRQWQES